MNLAYIIDKTFQIIYFILFVTIFLTWIPTINWQNQPFKMLREIMEIILNPFRRIIPPVGMLDLSPILCFLFLEILRRLLIWISINLGF